MFHYYTPWKRPKTFGVETFLGGVETINNIFDLDS